MQRGSTTRLPVDEWLPEIVAQARLHRAVVVTASPGAGKTTRVPPALAEDGPVMVLQPRRIAARAVARRIADERGWKLGREVGWHVRFDRRDSPETRVLVATEGILTARLQQDPLVSDFRTIVLDEFHERSIHADLGLALVKQAWLARDDLHIVVMSATLDTAAVSRYLRDCPVVDVPGRSWPVEISYRGSAAVEDVVVDELPAANGTVLVFLPGAREIAHAAARISKRVRDGADVVELHGGLDAERQDAALSLPTRPRVIVATNVAETTLTVPGVTVVVDAGWQKVARYDAERAIDRLDTERVTQDAADQRAGRAGRVRAGRAVRLWDRHARLAAHRSPDIARVDLVSPILEVLGWGGDPRDFDWFEAPNADRVDAALALLSRIGATDRHDRLTPVGHQIRRLPLHPRLARLLIAASGAPEAARAVALLSESRRSASSPPATPCDLWAAVHDGDRPPHLERIARDVRASFRAGSAHEPVTTITEADFRRAVLAAYPDRVARRRTIRGDKVLLATGTGARLGPESGVVDHEFIAAIEVTTSTAVQVPEAIVRMACGLEREWLEATATSVDHELDRSGRVRAWRRHWYGAIELSAGEIPPEPAEAARLIVRAILERGPTEWDHQLLARCAIAGVDATFESLARTAAATVSSLGDVRLDDALAPAAAGVLAREAPTDWPLPSGRRAKLDYRGDGRVVAAVKLQELFGLAESPRIARGRVPLTFELLAPNGRPVQVTSDLASFWSNGYQEVRRELRARYPRHPWPEDPWTAQPTHRTVKRR